MTSVFELDCNAGRHNARWAGVQEHHARHRSAPASTRSLSRAPPRVQFFTWLLLRQHINCRTNLKQKNIMKDAQCELCHDGDEDCDHLLFRYPFARQAWAAVGIDADHYNAADLWKIRAPQPVQAHQAN